MERHGKNKNKARKGAFSPRYLILSRKFFLSFPKLVKEISHGLLHSKQGHGPTPVHPSLRIGYIPSPCTYDFDQDPSFNTHKNNDHPCKNHGATVDTTSFYESLGRDLQPFSDQEGHLFPFELASLSSTATE